MKDKLIVVAGGGGFIGGHLVARLREQGCEQIRGVDVKPLDQWYQVFDDVDNIEADLKLRDDCPYGTSFSEMVPGSPAVQGVGVPWG